MLMAEGEEDVFKNRRAADHRQAVGQRRAEPRPFAGVFGVDAGEHPFRVAQQDPGPGHVGRRLQAPKFRCSGELDPGLDRGGDELEIRVYFRFKSGSYMHVRDDLYRDDWKESPVLESLVIEYEKDGAVVRHEELPR